jgi:hypothetical protein
VYAWSNKSWGDDAAAAYAGSDPIPVGLDWNLWLGSAAARPYFDGKYHPKQWRKQLDFGCGTLGDMGVHIINTPYAALKLGHPRSVKVRCRESNTNSLQRNTRPTSCSSLGSTALTSRRLQGRSMGISNSKQANRCRRRGDVYR